MQPNLSSVDAIDCDCTCDWFYYSEQCQQDLSNHNQGTSGMFQEHLTEDFPAPVLPQIPIFSRGF